MNVFAIDNSGGSIKIRGESISLASAQLDSTGHVGTSSPSNGLQALPSGPISLLADNTLNLSKTYIHSGSFLAHSRRGSVEIADNVITVSDSTTSKASLPNLTVLAGHDLTSAVDSIFSSQGQIIRPVASPSPIPE